MTSACDDALSRLLSGRRADDVAVNPRPLRLLAGSVDDE
jgi:hypothetical protein